jgi:hypothetical protein
VEVVLMDDIIIIKYFKGDEFKGAHDVSYMSFEDAQKVAWAMMDVADIWVFITKRNSEGALHYFPMTNLVMFEKAA